LSVRVALFLALLVFAFGATLHAQSETEPLALDYAAPPECPAASAFAAEIVARTPRARLTSAGERSRVFHVLIVEQSSEHAGRFWIEEEPGRVSSVREIRAPLCGEVVSALGLIAALAIDPRASTAVRPLPPSGPATVAAGGTAPLADAGIGTVTDAAVQSASVAADASNTSPSDSGAGTAAMPAPSPVVRTPERGAFEVGLQAQLGVIADAVLAGRLYGDVEIGNSREVFAPSIRFALARSLGVDRSVAGGTATLTFTTFDLAACPVRWATERSTLAFRPCVELSAGVLDASAEGVTDAKSRTRPWLALDTLGRLVWEPGAPTGPLALSLEAGATVPMIRESFRFQPTVPVYEAPTIAFLGRAGFGVRFP
jgi:hypothetical protein